MGGINIRNYLHTPIEEEPHHCGLTQNQRDELLEAFTLYDKDMDGYINTRELGTVIRSLGQVLTVCEETDIVAQFAQEKCYKIDFITFYKLMNNRYRKFDEDNELRESFRVFDKEDNGYVNVDELGPLLLTIGEPLTADELDDWLRSANDFIDDKKLYYENFATYMLSK